MVDETYRRVAREIKELLVREFGGFSREDLDRVTGIIGAQNLDNEPYPNKAYENLSEEDRDQIDFMMGL